MIRIDLSKPEQFNAPESIVGESANPLQGASCVHNDRLVLGYLQDVKDVLQVHDLRTGAFVATIPTDIGTVNGPTGRRKDSTMFYQHVSFLSPGVIYSYDFAAAQPVPLVFRTTKLDGFDPSRFQMEQVFYPSKDGTNVPMFIVSKKVGEYAASRARQTAGMADRDPR